MVEERSLKVLSNDTTFFNKVSNTLTKLLMPTKIGINGMMINIKRSSAIKAFEQYKENEASIDVSKKEQIKNKYEESYTYPDCNYGNDSLRIQFRSLIRS